MPLFMMPYAVQYLCGFVPGTYCCALFRFAFMSDAITEMTNYVVGIMPTQGAELMSQLTSNFGYNLDFFGVIVTPPYQALAITIFTVLLVILNIVFGQKLTVVIGGMSKKIFRRKKKDTQEKKD